LDEVHIKLFTTSGAFIQKMGRFLVFATYYPIGKVEPELRQFYIGLNVFTDESTLSNPGESLHPSYQNLADAEGFFPYA